ncbi:MAG: glycosyltransferase family 2 protein [Gammaproteobacteria bacterium]|nr:glycosyltransferase family 2 protein [Gammaproteobacteria bacterium]
MDFSIIIPTFNERENVHTITRRIKAALVSIPISFEIWFIDDSKDNTPQILEKLAQENSEVHYIHREVGRGLGTAVVEGFTRAKGQYLIVMDADLQHPPELLPAMIEKLQAGNEVVIPSRFIQGGSDGGLSAFRKLVSWTARVIGQLALKKLRKISDCTGGYFGLNRKVIENVKLDPIGWKILMEVLIKGHYSTVSEVPYEFVDRDAGESKMSMKEQWNYLRHIAKLVWSSPHDRRFYLFCLIGGLGVIVNLSLFSLFFYKCDFHPIVASVFSSSLTMLNNFLWNDLVTWKECGLDGKRQQLKRFSQYFAVSMIGIGITALTLQVFLLMNWHELLGQIAGIAIATLWNYFANKHWTWGSNSRPNGH